VKRSSRDKRSYIEIRNGTALLSFSRASQLNGAQSEQCLIVNGAIGFYSKALLKIFNSTRRPRTDYPIDWAWIEAFVFQQRLHFADAVAFNIGYRIHAQLTDRSGSRKCVRRPRRYCKSGYYHQRSEYELLHVTLLLE
jgi:hypothetical protein